MKTASSKALGVLALEVVDPLRQAAVDLDVEIRNQDGRVLLVFGHVADIQERLKD